LKEVCAFVDLYCNIFSIVSDQNYPTRMNLCPCKDGNGVERSYNDALGPVKETGSSWRIHHYVACTDFFS